MLNFLMPMIEMLGISRMLENHMQFLHVASMEL